MEPLVKKIIVEAGRAIGKAVLAGVGLELAKVATDHLRARLGPKDKNDKDAQKADGREDREAVRAENERLKAEVDRLREELAAARKG